MPLGSQMTPLELSVSDATILEVSFDNRNMFIVQANGLVLADLLL